MNDQKDRTHRAVLVEVGKYSELIDEVIAPLIQELWRADVQTLMSCQGAEDDKVWIAFDDAEQLARFLNIAAEYEVGSETLYNRICFNVPYADLEQLWEFEIFPIDAAHFNSEERFAAEEVERYEDFPDFFFMYSVLFPRSDLATVFERFTRYNACR